MITLGPRLAPEMAGMTARDTPGDRQRPTIHGKRADVRGELSPCRPNVRPSAGAGEGEGEGEGEGRAAVTGGWSEAAPRKRLPGSGVTKPGGAPGI